MSDSKPTIEHPAKQTKVGKFFGVILRIIGVLMFSALISILIEWIGMSGFYKEEGFGHAQKMLHQEMEYFIGKEIPENTINVGNLNSDSKTYAEKYIYWLHQSLLGQDGFAYSIKKFTMIQQNDGSIIKGFKRFVSDIYDYLIAAIFIFVVFWVRLSILFLSIPAFILFGLVGMVDGLMQRDIRRWTGGNESAFIYHWAKRFALPVLIVGWILYLAIPTSIHPNYIITPCALTFGLVIMVMSSKFKKYL